MCICIVASTEEIPGYAPAWTRVGATQFVADTAKERIRKEHK